MKKILYNIFKIEKNIPSIFFQPSLKYHYMMKYILSFVIVSIFTINIKAQFDDLQLTFTSDLPIVNSFVTVNFHVFFNPSDYLEGSTGLLAITPGDGTAKLYYNIYFGVDNQISHDYSISSSFVKNGMLSVTATALVQYTDESQNPDNYSTTESLLITANVVSTGYQLGITPIPDDRGQGYPATQTTIQFSYNIVSDKTPAIGELQLSIMNNILGTLVYSDVVDPSNINQTISLTDDKYKFNLYSNTNTFQAFLFSYGVQVAKSDPVDIVIGTGSAIVDCSNPPDLVLTVDPIMIDMNKLSGTYANQVLDIADKTPMGSIIIDCAKYVLPATGMPGQVYFDITDDKKNMTYSPYTYPVAAIDRYFTGNQPYLNDASANPYKVYKTNYDVESDISYIDVKLTYSYTTAALQSVVKTATQRITIYPQTCDDNNYVAVNNIVNINSHTGKCLEIVFYNPSNQNDDFSYITNIENLPRTTTLYLKNNYELNDRNFEAHIFVNSGYEKCYSAENANYRNVKITQPTLTSDLKYNSSDKTVIPNYTPPANTAYLKISGCDGSKYLANIKSIPVDLISDITDGSCPITIEAYNNQSVLLTTQSTNIKICKCISGCFNVSDIPNYDIYVAYNTDATTIGNTQINNKSVELYSPSIVQLRSGLSVSNGARFSAYIKNCSTLKSATLNKDSADINSLKISDIYSNIESKTSSIDFNVFPNPSRGIFNIVTEDVLTEKIKYVVIDISGKFILAGTINKSQTTIDMSGYKAGFYILKILSSNNYVFKKLVIN